jgi:hypothetical protein
MIEDELPEENHSEETGTGKLSSSGKTREQIQAEIRALSEKSKQHSQGRLFGEADIPEVDGEDEDDELGGFSLRNIADRDESHRLYFGMYGIMKRHLPQGKANLPLRRYVYDEVLLYLNQGKRKNARGVRGSSGQMAYIPTILEPAFAIVMDWVTNGANPFDLFSAFEAQNNALGYHGGGPSGPTTPTTGTTPAPTPTTPLSTAGEAVVEDDAQLS